MFVVAAGAAAFMLTLGVSLLFIAVTDPVRRRLGRLAGEVEPEHKAVAHVLHALEPVNKYLLPTREHERSRMEKRLAFAGSARRTRCRCSTRSRRRLRCLFLCAVLASSLWLPRVPTTTLLFFALLAAFIGLVLPNFVLNHLVERRQKRLRDAFPDALDMLVVCVEAGLGLTASIQRVAEELRFSHPELGAELALVTAEMRAGVDREIGAQGAGGADRARGHPRPGEPAAADPEVRHQHRRHPARVCGGVPRQAHAACRGAGGQDRHQADLPARVLPVPVVLRRRDRPGGDTLRGGVQDPRGQEPDSEIACAGCARSCSSWCWLAAPRSRPTRLRSRLEGRQGDGDQLYAGEPAIVHSTEYPVTSAADGIQRGDEAYREGKLDLAVYLYVQSLAFDSTRAEPFVKIGAIHEQKGNAALAEKAYELALERQPDNPAVCERLGLLYLQSGRDAEAPALFERAIALDPKRWRSYNGLGILADRRGDFTAAIGYYDKALAIDPAAATVMNNRGYSRYLAGDLPGAEADLKTAIRLGAKGSVWTNLGKVQAMQGRYAEALESLLQDKDLAHAYNLLGEAAMERGDFEAAKRYFESAISESPRYFEAAQKNLGLANERLLAAPANGATKVVLADTPVYSDGAVVGLVGEGRRGRKCSGPSRPRRWSDSGTATVPSTPAGCRPPASPSAPRAPLSCTAQNRYTRPRRVEGYSAEV